MAGRNLDITAKLSKKIAELTVVVHMLFKRNHEKEVEYDFFKLLSERERTNLMKENDAKVAWLEKQLEEQEAFRAKVEYKLKDLNELREKVSTLQATKSELEEHLSRKDEDLRISGIKIEGLKQQIEEYARELQGLKKGKYDKNDREIITDVIDSVADDNNDTRKLEEEISELKIKHKDEITKLYAEKVLLQNKVGSFNSAFSQEIDELKQMLDALSKRQVEDQQKIYDSEVKKNELAQSLKKSEEDKKSLLKKMQFLKDQLRLVVRNKPNQKGTLSEETQPQRTPRNIFETVCHYYFLFLILT